MPPVRYQPIGPLLAGEGSRAVLGLALEEGAPPHPVVLVWAPPELAQDAELVAKLARETQRAVVFEHPHILRVHGLVELEGGLVRVTEYADGEPLRRVLEVGERLPFAFAALVVADAALGIHYAHLAGNDDGTPLLHGDVRPETLMVSFGGMCRVTGYGALGVAPREPDGRRVLNRRKYSAPEQLLGGREALNVQSDVFLLGLVLYECLTGKIPFQDAPDADTATLTQPLPPLPPGLPRPLEAVLRKATAKRANERYPSALALRDALVEAVGELPSRESFAEHLACLFPPEGEVRRARRQVLEIGMAEALRRAKAPAGPTGAVAAPAPTAPTATPVARPAPAPALAAPKPQAPAPPAPPRKDVPAAPRRSRVLLPLAVGGLVLALAGVALPRLSEPSPAEPTVLAEPADAGALVVAEPADSGAVLAAESPDSGALVVAEPVDSGAVLAAEALDAGALLAAEALDAGAVPLTEAGGAPDAGAAGAVALAGQGAALAAGALLELFVDPQVSVSLGGRVLGRTPLTVELPPGRHVLSLSNPALGIQTARAVTLSGTERNLHDIHLRKGFISVRAPKGAAIVMDGRQVGTAPMDRLALYEGPHHIVVSLDGASWEQAFQLVGQKHMTFTVRFEEP